MDIFNETIKKIERISGVSLVVDDSTRTVYSSRSNNKYSDRVGKSFTFEEIFTRVPYVLALEFLFEENTYRHEHCQSDYLRGHLTTWDKLSDVDKYTDRLFTYVPNSLKKTDLVVYYTYEFLKPGCQTDVIPVTNQQIQQWGLRSYEKECLARDFCMDCEHRDMDFFTRLSSAEDYALDFGDYAKADTFHHFAFGELGTLQTSCL